jgi:hypothetical protein
MHPRRSRGLTVVVGVVAGGDGMADGLFCGVGGGAEAVVIFSGEFGGLMGDDLKFAIGARARVCRPFRP